MSVNLPPEQGRLITEATEDLDVAQRELARVLTELTSNLPRAQKTMISDVLKVAFEKVAAARTKLEGLAPKA